MKNGINITVDDTPTEFADYAPNHLLDRVKEILVLKNDAALARALCVPHPVISKLRKNTIPSGAALLIRMHEITNMSIRDLRSFMGDRGEHFKDCYDWVLKWQRQQRRSR